jgi:hypothetical protein
MRRITATVILSALLSIPAYAQTAQQEISRFVDFYGQELTRSGFRPDESSTRQTRIDFLQATLKKFCSPLLAMKRGDPGRPISDEVVVFLKLGPEYRVFADFVVSGGSNAWRLSHHIDGVLPVAQPLVNPITLGTLPEASFAPLAAGCSSAPPVVTPDPPTCPVCPPIPPKPSYPGDQFFIEKIGQVLEWDYAEAGQRLNAGSSVWFSRTIWRHVNEGLSMDESTARSRKEWRAALGLPQ